MEKRLCLITLVITIALSQVFSQNHNPFFTGYWYGLLEFQGSELILTFELKEEGDSLSGTLNSPLQGANGIPINKVIAGQDSLQIFIKTLGANFKGRLSENDSLIEGIFSQAIFKIPLKFQKTAELFTLKRPQEPQPPFDYIEEEVVFENKRASIKLAGTLTLPNTTGTYPAVILITGSGPQDRNEEILGHKPFLVIANYFTQRGIAVLRYDDRGIGKSGGVFATATSMDFATDVEAAVSFLRTHPHINTAQIGLLGHSEGGMIAPIVAARDKNISFIIMLAGPAITGEQILLTQIERIMALENTDEKAIKMLLKDSKKIYRILRKEPNNKKAAEGIRKYFAKRAKKMSADEQLIYGYTKQAVESKIMAMNSPWFRYFLTFDPEDYLRRVDCPTLAVFGDKDVQVLSEPNIKALERIIKKYKKDNFKIKSYPDKNHLFQNAQTGSISEYALIEETISVDVLDDMVKWIREKTQ